MRKNFLLLLMLFAVIFTGCTTGDDNLASQVSSPDEGISIVTTIFPLYDFARAVTGSEGDLVMLVDPGTEIHSYDPTPADIIKIQEADVFIYIGGENDAWVDTILASMDTGDKKIVRLIDYVDAVAEETVEGMEAEEADQEADQAADAGEEEGQAEYDEHIWTSPRNAILMVEAITSALASVDSANGEVYKKNAEAYTSDIQAVDDEIDAIVKQSKHKLLVFGDRFPFRYLVDEFGLDYRAAFNGCSSETEVSAGTLAYLINTVRDNGIPYIYYIEMSNQNIARSISEQTGAGLLLLHSCQSVSKSDFEAGVTYITLMKQNAAISRKV